MLVVTGAGKFGVINLLESTNLNLKPIIKNHLKF